MNIDKINKFLKLIWQSSSIYCIIQSFINFDDAAGGTIFNPESLKHLDKADEYLKNRNR